MIKNLFFRVLVSGSILLLSFKLTAQPKLEEIRRVNDSLRYLINKSESFKYSNNDSTFKYAHLAGLKAAYYKLPLPLGEALTLKAYAALLKGDYKDAESYSLMANDIFYKARQARGLMNAYRISGVVYGTTGDYVQAQDYNYRALRLAEHLKDSVIMGNLLNNLGIIYYYQKNYSMAMEMHKRVLNLNQKRALDAIKGSTLTNIAILYAEQKKFDLAIEYLEKAYSAGSEMNNLSVQGIALMNLGEVYYELKDYNTSIQKYEDALEIFSGYNMSIYFCTVYQGIGNNYLALNREDEAIGYITKAIGIALQTGTANSLIDAYESLSKLYYNKGEYKLAHEYLEKSFSLKDSLSRTEVLEKIANLEKLYETEKKDNKIRQLSIQEQNKQEKIEQQNRRILYLILATIAAAILLSTLFFQNRRLRMTYKKLVIKNLELMQQEKSRSAESAAAISQLTKSLSEGFETDKPLKESGSFPIQNNRITDDKEEDMISDRPEEAQLKYRKSLLNDLQKQAILTKVIEAIEERKVFLDPELSVESLSEELGIYRKYISQVINELLGKNFNMLINEYRVREARNLMINKEYQKFTLEAIGQMVGFNSKSSFNSAFKRFTGVTPSFFRETAAF